MKWKLIRKKLYHLHVTKDQRLKNGIKTTYCAQQFISDVNNLLHIFYVHICMNDLSIIHMDFKNVYDIKTMICILTLKTLNRLNKE